jgi:hypothetical protein
VAVDTGRLQHIREQLDPPLARDEERTLETGSVPIVVKSRANRYHLDDRGVTIAHARALGAPDDWLGIAEAVVARRAST